MPYIGGNKQEAKYAVQYYVLFLYDDLSSQAGPLEFRIMHKALKMGVI